MLVGGQILRPSLPRVSFQTHAKPRDLVTILVVVTAVKDLSVVVTAVMTPE